MSGSFVITNSTSAFAPVKRQDYGNQRLTAELGQIITATLTRQAEGVATLTTADGYQFEAASDRIVGQVGDELQFEVVKAGKNGLELKQIRQLRETAQAQDTRRTAGLKSMLKQSGMYHEQSAEYDTEDRELQLKAMEAASRIKRQLRYVTNNAGRSAMKELLQSGVSLEKISIDVLNSVMHEIETKPERQTSPDELEAMINKYLDANNVPVGEAMRKKQLVKALAEQGLPATVKNVRALDTVLIKLEEIENIDDDSIAKLLKDEKGLTVENIYLSKHTSARLPANESLTPDKWNMLKSEVERIFTREQIPLNDETMSAARLLVERELPVTASNIDKVIFLRDLENNLDTDKILYQAAGRIKQDRVLADVSVYADSLPAVYESVMADIPFVTASHMEFLLKQNPEPTVAECCQTLSAPIPAEISEKATAAHDRLRDIRRKLTYEAAGRLISKNIDITEMKLDEAIANLDKLAETTDYSHNLRAMGADASAENVSQMNELYTSLQEIRPTANHVFAALLSKMIPFTLRAVHETTQAGRLREGYEQFATVVTPRHGDSFAKMRDEFIPFLEAIDVTPTNDSIKAAGILSRNDMPVTPENITDIKLIDLKLTGIQDRLHPSIAASMIRDRLNPLDMHVDDVLSYIDGFNEEYGDGIGDKLTEHIRALDDSKTLTQDEREAMIAIYRTLNLIRQDQSAGLGISLKYGSKLTLGNLLADAKNYRRVRVGADIDVSLGDESIERTLPENNIRRMLNDVPSKALTECELNSMLLDKLSEQASPDVLKQAMDKSVEDLPLEEALELMAPEPDDRVTEERLNRMQESLRTAAEVSGAALSRMEYAQIPTTIANLQAMRLLENMGLGKALNALSGRLEDDNTEYELELPDSELANLTTDTADEVLEAVSSQLSDLNESVSSGALLDELLLIQNAVKVQQFIGRREQQITLPVKLHTGIADLSMYVLDEKAAQRDTAELLLSLDTPNLGNVRISARRTGTDVAFEISASDPHAVSVLKQNIDALRGYLADAGFSASEITFASTEDVPPTPGAMFSEFEYTI